MKKKQNGRSMIEMLGVLVLIGVLSVAALFGFTYAMNKHRANETIHDVMLRAANVPMTDEFYQTRPTGYAFKFPDLQNELSTMGYTLNTLKNAEYGYVYKVEALAIPRRVCNLILRLEPTDIDEIRIGENKEVYTRGAWDLCTTHADASEQTLMTFYFEKHCTSDSDCSSCQECFQGRCKANYNLPGCGFVPPDPPLPVPDENCLETVEYQYGDNCEYTGECCLNPLSTGCPPACETCPVAPVCGSNEIKVYDEDGCHVSCQETRCDPAPDCGPEDAFDETTCTCAPRACVCPEMGSRLCNEAVTEEYTYACADGQNLTCQRWSACPCETSDDCLGCSACEDSLCVSKVVRKDYSDCCDGSATAACCSLDEDCSCTAGSCSDIVTSIPSGESAACYDSVSAGEEVCGTVCQQGGYRKKSCEPCPSGSAEIGKDACGCPDCCSCPDPGASPCEEGSLVSYFYTCSNGERLTCERWDCGTCPVTTVTKYSGDCCETAAFEGCCPTWEDCGCTPQETCDTCPVETVAKMTGKCCDITENAACCPRWEDCSCTQATCDDLLSEVPSGEDPLCYEEVIGGSGEVCGEVCQGSGYYKKSCTPCSENEQETGTDTCGCPVCEPIVSCETDADCEGCRQCLSSGVCSADLSEQQDVSQCCDGSVVQSCCPLDGNDCHSCTQATCPTVSATCESGCCEEVSAGTTVCGVDCPSGYTEIGYTEIDISECCDGSAVQACCPVTSSCEVDCKPAETCVCPVETVTKYSGDCCETVASEDCCPAWEDCGCTPTEENCECPSGETDMYSGECCDEFLGTCCAAWGECGDECVSRECPETVPDLPSNPECYTQTSGDQICGIDCPAGYVKNACPEGDTCPSGSRQVGSDSCGCPVCEPCPLDQFSCGSECCVAANQFCCGGDSCCAEGHACCGGECCSEDNICVGDACCPTAQVCGDTCCANGESCVGGECCSTGDVCGDTCCSNGTCCDGTCCSEGQTCGNGGVCCDPLSSPCGECEIEGTDANGCPTCVADPDCCTCPDPGEEPCTGAVLEDYTYTCSDGSTLPCQQWNTDECVCETADDCGTCYECVDGTCVFQEGYLVCENECCDPETQFCCKGTCCSSTQRCGENGCENLELCPSGMPVQPGAANSYPVEGMTTDQGDPVWCCDDGYVPVNKCRGDLSECMQTYTYQGAMFYYEIRCCQNWTEYEGTGTFGFNNIVLRYGTRDPQCCYTSDRIDVKGWVNNEYCCPDRGYPYYSGSGGISCHSTKSEIKEVQGYPEDTIDDGT